jgi:hypothetical protein
VSALDARIRHLAREELASAGGAPASVGPDRVAELEKEVADLTARVNELEKAAAPAPTAKRTPRKTTEPGE